VKEYVLDANAVLRYFGVSEGQCAPRPSRVIISLRA
jgi:hypothetical protein